MFQEGVESVQTKDGKEVGVVRIVVVAVTRTVREGNGKNERYGE